MELNHWLSFAHVKSKNPQKDWKEKVTSILAGSAQNHINDQMSDEDLLELTALASACESERKKRKEHIKINQPHNGNIPVDSDQQKQRLILDFGVFVGEHWPDIKGPTMEYLSQDAMTSFNGKVGIKKAFFKVYVGILKDLVDNQPETNRQNHELALWLASVGEILCHLQKIIRLPSCENYAHPSQFNSWINSLVYWRHIYFHPERSGAEFLKSKNPFAYPEKIAALILFRGKNSGKLAPHNMLADVKHHGCRDNLKNYVQQLHALLQDEDFDLKVKERLVACINKNPSQPVYSAQPTYKHILKVIAVIRYYAEKYWSNDPDLVEQYVQQLWNSRSQYHLSKPDKSYNDAYLEYLFEHTALKDNFSDFIETILSEFKGCKGKSKEIKNIKKDLVGKWNKSKDLFRSSASQLPEVWFRIFDPITHSKSTAIDAIIDLYGKAQYFRCEDKNLSFKRVVRVMYKKMPLAMKDALHECQKADDSFWMWSQGNVISNNMPAGWLPQNSPIEKSFAQSIESRIKASEICGAYNRVSHFSQNVSLRHKQMLLQKIQAILCDPECKAYRDSASTDRMLEVVDKKNKLTLWERNFSQFSRLSINRPNYDINQTVQDVSDVRASKFLPKKWASRFSLICRVIHLEDSIKHYKAYDAELKTVFDVLKGIRGYRSHVACVYLPSLFCRGFNKENIVSLQKHFIKDIHHAFKEIAKEIMCGYLQELGFDSYNRKAALKKIFRKYDTRNEFFDAFIQSSEPEDQIKEMVTRLTETKSSPEKSGGILTYLKSPVVVNAR